MIALEVARLLVGIASINPHQKFTDETAVFWHQVLVDVDYRDALAAVEVLARRQPFIGVNDICLEVAAIRKARVQSFKAADEVVPNVDPDDAKAFAAERFAIMASVANGTFDRARYELGGLTLTGITAHVPRALVPVEAHPEEVQRAIVSRLRLPRPPRPLDSERAVSSKAAPLATISAAATAAAEEERGRQLDALHALVSDDVS